MEPIAINATIQFDTPDTDGLYLQNRWISIRVITTNISERTDNATISILLFQSIPRTSSNSPNELKIDEIRDRMTLAPGQATSNFVNHSYLAGSYRIEVSTAGEHGRGTVSQKFLDIVTLQELYSKQQAEYSKEQVDIATRNEVSSGIGLTVSIGSAVTIGLIAIFTMIATFKQAESAKQSTELARMELKERLQPQLELRETSALIRSANNSIQFRGQVRNVGAVAARNITGRLAIVDSDQLSGILRRRADIMREQATIVGTLMPGGEFLYVFDKAGTQSQYVVIWFQYNFLRDEQEEACVWINVVGGTTANVSHRWWVDEDINPDRHPKRTRSKKGLWFFGKRLHISLS